MGMGERTTKPDYLAVARAWEQRTGWLRRLSNRFGLQGKLVICFLLLLTGALGGSSMMYLRQSKQQLSDMIGEQARQISSALALASKTADGLKPAPELHRIGQDLRRTARAHDLVAAEISCLSASSTRKANPACSRRATPTSSPRILLASGRGLTR